MSWISSFLNGNRISLAGINQLRTTVKSACGTRRAVVAASFFPDHGQSTWRVLKDM